MVEETLYGIQLTGNKELIIARETTIPEGMSAADRNTAIRRAAITEDERLVDFVTVDSPRPGTAEEVYVVNLVDETPLGLTRTDERVIAHLPSGAKLRLRRSPGLLSVRRRSDSDQAPVDRVTMTRPARRGEQPPR